MRHFFLLPPQRVDGLHYVISLIKSCKGDLKLRTAFTAFTALTFKYIQVISLTEDLPKQKQIKREGNNNEWKSQNTEGFF